MPNRIIKDNIRISNKINKISDASFRLWVYLLTYVDDYGRGLADIDVLKGFLYPKLPNKTKKNIEDALNELASIGLIHLYEADGDLFLYFPNWDEYQTVRNKRSKYPTPDENKAIENNCNQMQSNVSVIQSNPIQSESESESTNNVAQPQSGGEQKPDYEAIISLFNTICVSLPSIRSLTDSRKKAISKALPCVEKYGGWEKLFNAVQHSDFLTGRSGTWTNCGLDWILKPNNLTKIIEGNYRNKDDASEKRRASYDIKKYERDALEKPLIYQKRENGEKHG